MSNKQHKSRTFSGTIIKVVIGTMLAAVIVLNSVRIVLQFYEERTNAEQVATNIERERRETIKALVDNAMSALEIHRETQQTQIRALVKVRTKIAVSLIKSMVATRGNESLEQTKYRIREALRTVRFLTPREYFFATSTDGIEQISPLTPELEGTNLLQNPEHRDVITQILTVAKKNGEGYVQYQQTKGEISAAGEGEKLTYVELIPELGWVIGTGIYQADVDEEEEEATLLEYIRIITHPKITNLFVTAWDGKNISSTRAPSNLLDATDKNGKFFVREAIELSRNKGGFIEYDLTDKDGFTMHDRRLAYVRGDPKRQWTIGVSTSKDEMDDDTAKLQAAIHEKAGDTLSMLATLTAMLIMVVFAIGYFLRDVLQHNFGNFKTYLTTLISEGKNDPSKLPPYAEFANVGEAVSRLVADRYVVAQKLQESERRSQRLLATVSDGIVSINRDGQLDYINAGALEILGYESEADAFARGGAALLPEHLDINTLFAEGDKQDDTASQNPKTDAPQIDPAFEALPGESRRSICKRTNGSEVRVEYNCTPSYDDGELVGMVITVRDIEARYRVEQEQLKARLIAEEATRAKSEFLANMSHEIRTPMNAVIGMTHLALETGISGRAKNFVEKASLAARNLMGIINDILDFSKIEARRMTLETIAFRLEDVIENLESITTTAAEAKRLHWKSTIDSDVPTSLHGDPLRLGQVLSNLCGNAIKFTDCGDIALCVAVASRAANKIELRFSIHDSGIGLTKEQTSRIFGSFSQADMSTTREYGGTGLGLAISKSLVELMGGKIWVESVLGKGSTFHFTAVFEALQTAEIPRESQRNGLSEMESEADRNIAQLKGARILLVDDNELSLELTNEILQTAGIEVVIARNGREALKHLNSGDFFDGVLLDCQMPVMNGYETVAEIRRQPEWATLPVLAMSAGATDSERQQALHAGMNDHISKPILVSPMFSTMARWINPAKTSLATLPPVRPNPGNDANAEPAAAQFPELPGIDTRQGMVIALGNSTLYRRFLTQFSEAWSTFNIRFAQAAMDDEDPVAARRLAHTLRGNAGSIGAFTVQQAAARLEVCCEKGSADEISDALTATEAALAVILPGLSKLEYTPPPPPVTVVYQRAEDPIGLREKIILLGNYMVERDGSALDLADELYPQLIGDQYELVMRDITWALDDIDFDRAYVALRELIEIFDETHRNPPVEGENNHENTSSNDHSDDNGDNAVEKGLPPK